MARILVVDDDSGMRAALRDVLTQNDHHVVEAVNGKVARELVTANAFDLVISDFQMPHLDGVELLTWIKKNHPVPVILITGFSHILETQQAFSLGADDFLTKPFTYMDILKAINGILNPDTKEQMAAKNLDEEFCRVPIDDFVSSEGVKIAVFVRLSSEKYVRVAHKGDILPTERVDNYKRKGVTYLYVRKEDFAQLVDFNLQVVKALGRNSRIDPVKKANFVRYTTETVLEGVFVNGIDKQSFQQAKDCLESSLSLITESEGLFNLLDILNSHANWIYAHSLGVGVYGVMIAKQMGWTGQPTLFKISTAGIFHDIGKKEIDTEILEKERPLLTQAERSLIETHPSRGKEILEQLKEIPGDIVQVVFEHHEDCIGQGFPRQITKHKIHPLARVISVANRFCNYCLKSPHSEGCDATQALQLMELNWKDRLDKDAVSALKSLCK